MTVSTPQSSTILLGNGVTTSWNIPFIMDSADFIEVIYTNTSGTQTTLDPALYTLTLNSASIGSLWGIGGILVYPLVGSPIANGTSLTVQRTVPLTQVITISNQGDFAPQVIEEALDTLCFEIQQIAARTGQMRGTWVTATDYNFGDVVRDGANGANSGSYYMCAISNTSGVWATDLAAGDWTLAIQSVAPSISLPVSIPNGGTGAATAAAARTALGLGSVATESLSSVIVDSGTGALTVNTHAITNAMLTSMAANTFKGNNTATAGGPSDIVVSNSQLIGRGSAGNLAAISLGAGLSISTSTLNAFTQSSWTPALNFSGSPSGITYSSQVGDFVQMGGATFATAAITLSNKGTTVGVATITGFPVLSTRNCVGSIALNTGGVSWPTNAYALTNSGSILLRYDSGTTVIDLTASNFTNVTNFFISIMYI